MSEQDVPAQVAETGAEQTNVPAQDVEAKARQYGWRPKEEWKGDDSRWVDAETFVKRGDEVIPIIKADRAKLEKALEKANEEIAEMRDTFSQFKQYHSQTQARAYQQAMRDLEQRQAQAVEANDLAEVRETTKEIAALAAEMTVGQKPVQRSYEQEFNRWKADNAWFETDTVMRAAAAALGDEAVKKGLEGKAQLDFVSERIRKEFPHKFENPNRTAPAAVEGGGQPPKKSGKGWADLPAEAKAFADRMVKQGLITKDQYAKDYFA